MFFYDLVVIKENKFDNYENIIFFFNIGINLVKFLLKYFLVRIVFSVINIV